MKFTVSQSSLAKALLVVSKGMASNSTLAYLMGIYIKASEGTLEFQTANNNYLRARADEMNSLFRLLIRQAVVRYYAGTEYVNQ